MKSRIRSSIGKYAFNNCLECEIFKLNYVTPKIKFIYNRCNRYTMMVIIKYFSNIPFIDIR